MTTPICPGQNQQYWKPEDIFETPCPTCGTPIEFWKDDPVRPCPACKTNVHNIRISMGCAKWCKHSAECLGVMGGQLPPEAVVCVQILGELEKLHARNPSAIHAAKVRLGKAERLLEGCQGSTLAVKVAALLWDISDPGEARTILERSGLPAAGISAAMELLSLTKSSENALPPEANLLRQACIPAKNASE